jgi:hypothetical protein
MSSVCGLSVAEIGSSAIAVAVAFDTSSYRNMQVFVEMKDMFYWNKFLSILFNRIQTTSLLAVFEVHSVDQQRSSSQQSLEIHWRSFGEVNLIIVDFIKGVATSFLRNFGHATTEKKDKNRVQINYPLTRSTLSLETSLG